MNHNIKATIVAKMRDEYEQKIARLEGTIELYEDIFTDFELYKAVRSEIGYHYDHIYQCLYQSPEQISVYLKLLYNNNFEKFCSYLGFGYTYDLSTQHDNTPTITNRVNYEKDIYKIYDKFGDAFCSQEELDRMFKKIDYKKETS